MGWMMAFQDIDIGMGFILVVSAGYSGEKGYI